MPTNDFYIAGRWRNRDNIKAVLDAVRASGRSAYCFIENTYENEELPFTGTTPEDIEASMQATEVASQDHPSIRKIFADDLAAERDAKNFLLVLPAGLAAHIEAGIAYGMGKKCYAVGQPEKTETLYCIFDKMFPDLAALEAWLRG
ncbi:MAG TPA: hypothetical protein VF466_00375 [Candidatus Saccharimonadales bacterium]